MIQPSHSPFVNLVSLVKKKDKTWRFHIDYIAVDKLTVPNLYPIQMVEALLDELRPVSFFFLMNLKSGYYQIRINEEDKPRQPLRYAE